MMNKEDQLIAWLCGEKVEFPFFKDLLEVEMPESVGVNPEDGDHDCKLDDLGTGHCNSPSHGEYEPDKPDEDDRGNPVENGSYEDGTPVK